MREKEKDKKYCSSLIREHDPTYVPRAEGGSGVELGGGTVAGAGGKREYNANSPSNRKGHGGIPDPTRLPPPPPPKKKKKA